MGLSGFSSRPIGGGGIGGPDRGDEEGNGDGDDGGGFGGGNEDRHGGFGADGTDQRVSVSVSGGGDLHLNFGDRSQGDEYSHGRGKENLLSGGAVGGSQRDPGDCDGSAGVVCGGGSFEKSQRVCPSRGFV